MSSGRVAANAAVATTDLVIAHLWHARLGHPNVNKLQRITKTDTYQERLKGNYVQLPLCEACINAKHHVTPYPAGGSVKAPKPLHRLHTDLCGPVSVASSGGARYFMTIVDNHTRYVWVHVLKRKSEVLEIFRNFQSMIEKQLGLPICTLTSDNGGEFDFDAFHDYCRQQGIRREFTALAAPAKMDLPSGKIDPSKKLQELS